jgi:hypothetical protein
MPAFIGRAGSRLLEAAARPAVRRIPGFIACALLVTIQDAHAHEHDEPLSNGRITAALLSFTGVLAWLLFMSFRAVRTHRARKTKKITLENYPGWLVRWIMRGDRSSRVLLSKRVPRPPKGASRQVRRAFARRVVQERPNVEISPEPKRHSGI